MDKTTASTIQPLTPPEAQELLKLLDSFQQEMQRVCGLPPEWTRYPMPGESLPRALEVNWQEIERQLWRRMLSNVLPPKD